MSLLELSLALLDQSLPLSMPSSGFNFVLVRRRRVRRKEEEDKEGESCQCFQAGTEWVAQFWSSGFPKVVNDNHRCKVSELDVFRWLARNTSTSRCR